MQIVNVRVRIGIIAFINSIGLLNLYGRKHTETAPLSLNGGNNKKHVRLRKLNYPRGRKILLMIILFTVLTLTSIVAVYAVHQNPTEETITETLCTYSSTAFYDYTATLETPNTISDNKTELKPNEGLLYAKITKQIDITLEYIFHATLPTEPRIVHSLTQTLRTEAWEHQIATTAQVETNQTTIRISIPTVIKETLQGIKARIDAETGTSTSEYSLEIAPTFSISASTAVGPINQYFRPVLTLRFERTIHGDVITVENLNQIESDKITDSHTVTHHDILSQRYASYALTSISVAGLCLSMYTYRRTKVKQEKKEIDKLIVEYKDLIIETQEPPIMSPDATIVKVDNMKELAKTAEILARPIIHITEDEQHIFCIIENNTIYRYSTDAHVRTQGESGS